VPDESRGAVADRLAIADLVHGYAQGLDRREPDAVAQLFTEDASFATYVTPGAEEPFTTRHGRADIADALRTVRHYRATTHSIASHLATVDGDRATGQTRCVAFHVLGDAGAETLMVWHLHYDDAFLRTAEGWRIDERVLRVDVITHQPLDAR
jgi:hypothetical protein